MKKSIYKRKFLISFFFILFISCTKQDNLSLKSPAKSDSPEETYEELISKGWKEVKWTPKVDASRLHSENMASVELLETPFPRKYPITQRNLLDLYADEDHNDMSFVLSDFSSVKDAYLIVYPLAGSIPSKFRICTIDFTDVFRVESKPPLRPLEYFKGFSYFVVDAPVLSDKKKENLPPVISTLGEYINNTDSEMTFSVKFKYTRGYKTEWHSSGGGISTNERITIAIPDTIGTTARNVKLNVTTGPYAATKDGVDSLLYEYSDNTEVTVPAHSKVEVKQITVATSTTVNYKIPLNCEGTLGIVFDITTLSAIGVHSTSADVKPFLARRMKDNNISANLTRYEYPHIIHSPAIPIE